MKPNTPVDIVLSGSTELIDKLRKKAAESKRIFAKEKPEPSAVINHCSTRRT